jgi:PAS domain S-box-containing protein
MEPNLFSSPPVIESAVGSGDWSGQLVELSADLFATVGPDGHVKWCNASWRRTLGWSEDQMLDRPFTEFVHPDDAARTTNLMRRAFVGEDRVEFENRCRVAHGDYQIVSWRLAPADGVALLAGTDITRERSAEEAARRLKQHVEQRTAELGEMTEELEAFNYSVSHDLRAPLRAIDGFTSVVAREYAERLDDSGREMLDRVRNGVAKLNTLIDAMLVLSRRSRQDLRLRRVDLSELARVVVSDLRERDPQRRVEVVVADSLSAVGDRELLRIVLEQLLGNAWKFTADRDDARIEFSGETEDGCQRYVVRDNGAGFDMAYADRLFVPFQRLHRDAEFSGIGAGLAIAQRIVRRHGGSIRGEGRPGAGASFHFDLDGANQELP